VLQTLVRAGNERFCVGDIQERTALRHLLRWPIDLKFLSAANLIVPAQAGPRDHEHGKFRAS